MRSAGFAHINSGKPLTFYAAESGYNMLADAVKKYNISENDINLKLIKPFESFETEGYVITPILTMRNQVRLYMRLKRTRKACYMLMIQVSCAKKVWHA